MAFPQQSLMGPGMLPRQADSEGGGAGAFGVGRPPMPGPMGPGVPQGGPRPGLNPNPYGGPMPQPQPMQQPQGPAPMPPQASFGPHPGMGPGVPPPGPPIVSYGPHPGPAPGPPQSVEQQALAGGGVDNKQQISNFMQALQRAQAGGGNTQMGVAAPPQAPLPNLVDPNAVGANNAASGQAQAIPQQAIHPGMLGAGNPGAAPAPAPQAPWTQGAVNGQTASYAPGMQPQGQPQQPPPQFGVANAGNMPGLPPGPLKSDARAKTDIAPAENQLHAFLGAIGAHNYEYKNPARDGYGTFTSPMAQELERTELGKQAVVETPHGKMIDYARLGGVNLAAVSVVHREQERLRGAVERLRAEVRRRR